MRHIFIFLIFIWTFIINLQPGQAQNPGTSFPGREENKKTRCDYTVIPSGNNTWGYDIYLQKRLFIHQTSIPGLSGNEGFKTKASARKAARLVVGKIKKSEMPPTVTIEELKKIQVL